ncbi:hypothetical protein FBU30_010507 [Linnemannia zychae]|nr:hypothetical protein FBU30_010507 [Linnemannia zychae]
MVYMDFQGATTKDYTVAQGNASAQVNMVVCANITKRAHDTYRENTLVLELAKHEKLLNSSVFATHSN